MDLRLEICGGKQAHRATHCPGVCELVASADGQTIGDRRRPMARGPSGSGRTTLLLTYDNWKLLLFL